MTRTSGIFFGLFFTVCATAQGGDQQLRAKADGFFEQKNFLDALPLYSQLVSLTPADRSLNYRLGACLLFGGEEKGKAIGHLKYAVEDPGIPPEAWYWLGRAYHLSYLFKDAQAAYQRYQGTGSKKELEGFSVASLDKQCRNGQQLLSNLKEITVRNKVEVEDTEFFRFYELDDIGGKIVVLPEELKTSLDKKSKQRTLVYLPEKGGAIYYGSYGKDGKTGRDIYRTELLTSGEFAQPIKLAGYVNTDQDEDFAFLHPDGRSFYFSSKGHNSMGGYDVFRSAYDKGLDTFGPPENLDFAVNTPDDDIFYMVDAESKEACFASGRDSEQGKLHVYRVSTAQVPVVLTVLKGTFANAFNADDRKAHIVVEDAVTRERIADVRTDINGSYVLSVPRSGQFRFAVECGPAGKTHQGMVDIPRSTSARAYRQELELIRRGDLEELVIRNYFDESLEEDMIALMMEEIQRRARLDVTTDAPVVAASAVNEEAPKGDPLTQAGFAGDVTEAKALSLAKEDALELERSATLAGDQSKAAFSLAVQSLADAERTAREAEALVSDAATGTVEETRNAKMLQAAQARQLSREANHRARAAFHTGQDLDADRMARATRAAQASKLAMDLEQTLAARQEAPTLAALKQLKERLDTRSGPNGDLTAEEQARRTLAEQEKEAARSLSMANAKRAEENEFIDRIERVKREREDARSKGRKDELSREITQSEQQLAYLSDEVQGAFAKAKEQERLTATLRGQYALTRHLTATGASLAGTEVSKDQLGSLGVRIAGNGSRIENIPIDERYDAQLAAFVDEAGTRTFNWELAAGGSASSAGPQQTLALERDPSKDARPADSRTVAAPSNALAQGEVRTATVGDISPDGKTGDLASVGGAVGEPVNSDGGEEESRTTPASAQEAAKNSTDEAGVKGSANVADGANGNTARPVPQTSAQSTTSTNGSKPPAAEPVTKEVEANIAQRTPTETTAPQVAIGSGNKEGVEGGAEPAQEQNSSAAPALTSAPAANADGDAPPGGLSSGAELDQFLLENQKAELEQAFAAEKNSARKAEIRSELVQVTARIEDSERIAATKREAEALELEERSSEGVDMDRMPITFYPDSKEADIIAMVYADHATDKRKLEALEDQQARAEGLNVLELMLADSLRGEMVRQAAILELDPQQGARVLPKLERLRMMRQDHLQQADRILSDFEATVAVRTVPVEDAPVSQSTRTKVQYALGEDPVADHFIFLDADPEEVYVSKVVHRSKKVDDAVAFKEADLARMDLLDQQIDSLEDGLVDLPRKEYDKERKKADKLIDERMIIRADLGQRSAYLSKEEWSTANDSIKLIDKRLNTLGLAPNENILLMAQRMQADAKTLFSQAEGLRKRADRSDDILFRDSLFRAAYGNELLALQEMDRAITVKNYLVSDAFTRGETLAYEPIARSVLGIVDGPEEAATVAEVLTRSELGDPKTLRVSEPDLRTTTELSELASAGTSEPSLSDTAITNISARAEIALAANSITSEPLVNDPPTKEIEGDAISGRDLPASSQANTEVTSDMALANVERARAEALALAARTEASLPTKALVPAKRYEDFLRSETVMLQPEALDPEQDPALLAVKARSVGQQSAAVELRSLDLAEQATLLADSAAKARKRDQAGLSELAVRTRFVSDSLHAVSMLLAEEARSLELKKRDAEQAKVLKDRLIKYYYLSSEEQAMVVGNKDESLYFQAKARALEQYDAAKEAEDAARINRELGTVLRKEAAVAEAEKVAGRTSPEEAQVRIEVLSARATVLDTRGDSLSNIAARLRGAAGINEGQASVMLQAMAADRSTETMALEMRTRRTEALLAETRDQAGSANARPLQAGVPVDANAPRAALVPTTQAEQPLANNTPVTTRTPDRVNDPIGTTGGGAADDGLARSQPQRVMATPFGTDSNAPTTSTPRPIASTPLPAGLPYMIPEILVNDMFELRSADSREPTPIPMDAQMPEGVVFKVQVGAFRSAISETVFSDMTPVMGERTDNGYIRYTAGMFTGFDQAAQAKDKVRDRGYRDAFVVAYRDGNRIPLGVAMREARAASALASNTNSSNPTNAAVAAAEAPAEGAPVRTPTQPARSIEGNTVLEPNRVQPAASGGQPAVIQSPVAVQQAAAPLSTEQVLAKYPPTAEAIVSQFAPAPEATAYYNVPGAAPADQVETIRGLFYTVQVGVYSKPVPLGKLFNITPLNSERTERALVRYTTGRYMDTELARARKEQAVALGVKDAFITAYLNGKRIPMQEAAALLQQFGPAILAKP